MAEVDAKQARLLLKQKQADWRKTAKQLKAKDAPTKVAAIEKCKAENYEPILAGDCLGQLMQLLVAKKKNAPRETRCTACAPNHAGEGSNPTRATQWMERSRGSASSRRSTARSVVRAKSVTYSARAEILEMAWPTAPHPAHVAVMHALPAHAANIPPHANIREDERTTRRREARGDVRAV